MEATFTDCVEEVTKSIEEQKLEHLQIIESEIDQQIEDITRLTYTVFGEQNVEVLVVEDWNRVSARYFREYTVTILFDRIDITNSAGNKHTIRYLLVRLYIHCTISINVNSEGNVVSSWSLGMPARMSGKRLACSTAEQDRGYQHSHLPGRMDSLSSSAFNDFCLGTTNIVTLLGILNEDFNLDTYELLLYTIEAGIGWESLEGVPYVYIRNLDASDNVQPYAWETSYAGSSPPNSMMGEVICVVKYLMDSVYIRLLRSINADSLTQLIEARRCTVFSFEVNLHFLEELVIKHVPLPQHMKLLMDANGTLYNMYYSTSEPVQEDSSKSMDEDTFTITVLSKEEARQDSAKAFKFKNKWLKYEVYETRKEREKTRYREVPSRMLLFHLAKRLTEDFTQFQQRQAVTGKHKRYKDKPLPVVREFIKAVTVHDTPRTWQGMVGSGILHDIGP